MARLDIRYYLQKEQEEEQAQKAQKEREATNPLNEINELLDNHFQEEIIKGFEKYLHDYDDDEDGLLNDMEYAFWELYARGVLEADWEDRDKALNYVDIDKIDKMCNHNQKIKICEYVKEVGKLYDGRIGDTHDPSHVLKTRAKFQKRGVERIVWDRTILKTYIYLHLRETQMTIATEMFEGYFNKEQEEEQAQKAQKEQEEEQVKTYTAKHVIMACIEIWREEQMNYYPQFEPGDTLCKLKELCKDYRVNDKNILKVLFEEHESGFIYNIETDEIEDGDY